MTKKAVLLAMILVAMCVGTSFAYQIDSLGSGVETVAPPTQVFVNPGGTGDALIYGYYNVRDNYTTIFTVTNTDTVNGARVRIRFREAATLSVPASRGCKNGSQEVLDFDICLSKGDMWSGQISEVNGGGVLTSGDTDTFVQVGDSSADIVIFPTEFPNGVPFKFGSNNLGITADQTLEGYFEIIAEQRLSENCGPNSASKLACSCGDQIDTSILNGGTRTSQQGDDVSDVLMGHAYIVNMADSSTFAYAATALGSFSIFDITNDINSERPNFLDDNETGASNIAPVNYALTKSNLFTIYDLESGIAGASSVIVNFPTKWATHGETISNTCTSAFNPTKTDDVFDDTTVFISIWDDQEHSPKGPGCRFSPCEPGTSDTLPHEVNVIDLNNGGIFTSDVETTKTTTFDFGWIDIDLVGPANAGHATTFNGQTAVGLPAIGYVAHSFGGGDFSAMLPLQYSSR